MLLPDYHNSGFRSLCGQPREFRDCPARLARAPNCLPTFHPNSSFLFPCLFGHLSGLALLSKARAVPVGCTLPALIIAPDRPPSSLLSPLHVDLYLTFTFALAKLHVAESEALV